MNQDVPRYRRILEYLEKYDGATINSLASLFMVSHMSIRRDLKNLQNKGLIKVAYGGEIRRSFLTGTPHYRTKQERFSESKKTIGQLASKLLQPGMTIFIDGGTTMREFSLNIDIPVTIVTLDLHVALELANKPEIKTIICPGEVQPYSMATYNSQTMKFLSGLVLDLAFIGADGFTLTDGALTTNQVKADCKWMAISRSVQSVLLADSSKWGLRCRHKITDLNQFNYIISEKKLPDDTEEKLLKQEVNSLHL